VKDRESTLYSPRAIYEKTLVLRGFSKSHAMTGWRLAMPLGRRRSCSR
jgi:aspartate/methionine/tyrosine aminotransferase